ncbi:ISAon1 family transposase N-terminal region protein [Runella sp.]|uniref:ISAon1 family transposase N-terminal region protein n=1 Tax=Runella sp. TaxID=1960881 RepID=UPI003D09C1A5
MESFLPIVHIQLLLPEFLLENFILISVNKQDDCFHVHLEEKNASANDPVRSSLFAKGFFPTITVQDFPLRGRKVKRRKWLNTMTGKVVYQDWTEVEKGTRMTSEFARYAAEAFF